HQDRVATVTWETESAEATDKRPKEKEPVRPKEKERVPRREAERDTIPPEYVSDYKHSAKKVNSRWWQALQKIRTLVPIAGSGRGLIKEGAKKTVGEGLAQGSDANRYKKEIEKERDVHRKLWGIRPMRGLLFDKDVPNYRDRIKGWLREGGYDVKKMWPEWVTHWLRKGVK
ncbi:MAG: hypothetical protein KJO44_04340, partial [Gemmatimonadetes bacterium]|nr:hypothetical protein [Gemmatimonadota bacterium]